MRASTAQARKHNQREWNSVKCNACCSRNSSRVRWWALELFFATFRTFCFKKTVCLLSSRALQVSLSMCNVCCLWPHDCQVKWWSGITPCVMHAVFGSRCPKCKVECMSCASPRVQSLGQDARFTTFFLAILVGPEGGLRIPQGLHHTRHLL